MLCHTMVSDNMVALIINLNNVATVHAEDLTQLSSYSVQQLLQLNICLNVDFSIGELDRSHSPSLVKYPVYMKYLFYSQLFSAKICLLFVL